MIWETIRELLLAGLAAAVSENLVFVRALGLGELEYEEYTPPRAFRDAWIVTLMSVLAAVSGWGGRVLIITAFRRRSPPTCVRRCFWASLRPPFS